MPEATNQPEAVTLRLAFDAAAALRAQASADGLAPEVLAAELLAGLLGGPDFRTRIAALRRRAAELAAERYRRLAEDDDDPEELAFLQSVVDEVRAERRRQEGSRP